jgi:HlyD family secretion protein
MIRTYARGHSPIHYDNNAADASVGLQGAALISELRRLQTYLESERFRERERFPHAVDVRPAHSGSDHRRGAGSRTPPKSVNSAIDSLLHVLGLGRHKPIGGDGSSSLRGKTPALARRPLHQDANVLFHPWPKQKPERGPCPSTSTKMESGYAHHADAQHSAGKPPQASLLDRIGIRSPAEVRNGLRSGFMARRKFMRSTHAFERLRTAFAFLVSRARVSGLDDGSETDLSARLARTFEDEFKIGLRVLIVGIGILGGWSILVPLSGAVIVPGTLVVESNVKKIQHPTGGVVANIPVRDGMHVSAGDLLLRLDDTQLRANTQVLTQQLDQLRVRLARLIAERDDMDAPQMPHEMASRSSDDDVSRLWASEILLFKSRAAARRNAKELLRSHIGQLKEQISGLDAQVKSKADQHDLISGELEGVESLYQKGLVPLTRKASLQREAARLDGDRGQAAAAIAEANSKISEAELQAVRIDQDFRTEVMKDLREAQDKEAELVEKSVAARDLLRRVDLRAPISGIVHQLSVHTIGGVVTPGEVAMELVPESDELQIEAKLPPQDIDHVHSGQATYVRFSAFNQRTTPQLEGVVSYVSADLSHDRQVNPNTAYYTVRVTLPPSERRRLGSLQLVSGMPVEVFLQTGSRTMMSYLLKPITDQFKRMFN